jgi:hypothetical protein
MRGINVDIHHKILILLTQDMLVSGAGDLSVIITGICFRLVNCTFDVALLRAVDPQKSAGGDMWSSQEGCIRA